MAWKTCEYCNGIPPKNGCPNCFRAGGHEVKEKTTLKNKSSSTKKSSGCMLVLVIIVGVAIITLV